MDGWRVINLSAGEEWQIGDHFPAKNNNIQMTTLLVHFRPQQNNALFVPFPVYLRVLRALGHSAHFSSQVLLVVTGEWSLSTSCSSCVNATNGLCMYCPFQNPDIVLVHYLNVPYPDDNKMAVIAPSLALWGDKKEWTKEELVSQLKPMCKEITINIYGHRPPAITNTLFSCI